MDDESVKTGLNYTLLATPAEGLSGRFVRIDAKKFGKIKELQIEIIIQIPSIFLFIIISLF